MKHAVQRAGVDPNAIEDVLMGCANPEGATGSNIARQIALSIVTTTPQPAPQR